MQLKIEEWAQDNLSDDSKELIKEAVVCYKVGAYRSAYLMSYLAFKQTLRERIMHSAHPDNYTDKEWKAEILDKLDDDKWDKTINNIVDCGAQKKEGSIFVFSNRERIKNRYTYWKDIRNVCAHAKKEKIDSSTVESFWNYMQDDMSEFYVLGSRRYLKEQLLDAYRYYLCESDLHIKKLLIDAKNVFSSEINIFLKELMDDIEKINPRLVDEENKGFWKNILQSSCSEIQEAFIKVLLDKNDKVIDFYKYFENILEMLLEYDSRFVQDYLNPLICREYNNTRILDEFFWKILLLGLRNNSKVMDLERITSNTNNFLCINNIDLNSYDLIFLNEYSVFKLFILNRGKTFFYNDSDSQWEYYGYNNKISDSDMKKYFSFVEWDLELIGKIDYAIGEVTANESMRSNWDSKYNARIRRNCYSEIIKENIKKINNVLHQSNKELNEYKEIEQIISECSK